MPNPLDVLFAPRFYDADLPLMYKLGLNTRAELSRDMVDLGEYVERTDDGEVYYAVRVSVACLPAMFWQFDITPGESDGKACRVTTGSGSLKRYWPIVEEIASGMVVVEPAPTDKASLPNSPAASTETT